MTWLETREAALTRTDYRCEACGIHQDDLGSALHIHHRDRDHANSAQGNLQVLCRACHGAAHRELNCLRREAAEDLTDLPALIPIWPDTAKILGVSRQVAYKAATAGQIPTVKLGDRIRLVPTKALQELVETGSWSAASPAPAVKGGER